MRTIKERLQQSHRQEDAMNKQMGLIDKEVKELNKRKAKLSKMISGNMKYRNQLINQLPAV